MSSTSVAAVLARARALGVDRLDAQRLLGRAIGRPREWLIAHDEAIVDVPAAARFEHDLRERAAGVPLAYLLGEKEFHGLVFEVSPAVLVPRPETEVLVDWAIERLRELAPAAPRVADLGTGSGAIAAALKRGWPSARVVATDADAEALAVASRNFERLRLGVEARLGSWWVPLAGERFDLIVSNPPYVRTDDPHLAALHAEPRAALVAGGEGLDALREIVSGAAAQLVAGGSLLLEHGFDQAEAVQSLLTSHGFVDVETRCDLADRPRCTGGRRVPPD
jgi:release factor glutamine methyltransferase